MEHVVIVTGNISDKVLNVKCHNQHKWINRSFFAQIANSKSSSTVTVFPLTVVVVIFLEE